MRTLALGTVEQTSAGEAHATDRRYFSRLADADTFIHQATLATYRAGTECAGVVCAVLAGADWLQELVDVQRPDAVRILDFAHAAEHVATVAQAVWGTGTAATSLWVEEQLHTLKWGAPSEVLAAVAAWTRRPRTP